MAADAMADRLDRLASSLRQQGLIHLGERDLMVEAAQLIRDLQAMPITSYTTGDGSSPYELQARARAQKEQS